jgi:hypothetical protein
MVINRMLLFLWLISTFSIPSTDAVAQVKFQDSYPLTGAKQPTAALAADLNLDGKPDVVVVDAGSSTVNVLLNTGAASFSISKYPVPFHPLTVKVADFNDDGIPNIAVSDSQGVSILLGKRNGKFSPAKTYSATPPNQAFTPLPNGLGVGDFNGIQ